MNSFRLLLSVKNSFIVVLILGFIFDNSVLEIRGEIVNQNKTWAEKLRTHLFHDYDKHVKPSEKIINVSINLHISHIEFDGDKSIFTVHGQLYTTWIDPKLKWYKGLFGDVDYLPLNDKEIWRPDVLLYNTLLMDDTEYFGKSHCHVDSTGNVTWVPQVKFQTFCVLNPKLWPYDYHTCAVVIGSWTYDAFQINLELINPNRTNYTPIIRNNIWEVMRVTSERQIKFYDCCVEPYVSLHYNVTIQRRPSMYKTVVFTPTVCIVLMTLSTFWLPPQRGEKILLNAVNLLIIILFLRYFANLLPIFAQHPPLIVKFYSNALIFVTFSTLISILVLYLTKTKHSKEVPKILQNVLTGCLGKTLCIGNSGSSGVDQTELTEKPDAQEPTSAEMGQKQSAKGKVTMNKEVSSKDWISVAIFVDRAGFFIFCIGFSTAILSIFI